jgi:hypothetical protein
VSDEVQDVKPARLEACVQSVEGGVFEELDGHTAAAHQRGESLLHGLSFSFDVDPGVLGIVWIGEDDENPDRPVHLGTALDLRELEVANDGGVGKGGDKPSLWIVEELPGDPGKVTRVAQTESQPQSPTRPPCLRMAAAVAGENLPRKDRLEERGTRGTDGLGAPLATRIGHTVELARDREGHRRLAGRGGNHARRQPAGLALDQQIEVEIVGAARGDRVHGGGDRRRSYHACPDTRWSAQALRVLMPCQ